MREIYSNAKIKRISILIIVKDIDNRKYNTSEYIKFKIYLLDKNRIAIIERELYINNNLIVKVLIEINIIKLERIIVDLENNVIKIDIYDNIKISIVIITKESSINITIYSNKRITILTYFNVAILVIELEKTLHLSNNRDLLFKLKTLDTLSIYAYIVNYNVLKIFVRNDFNKLITLLRR